MSPKSLPWLLFIALLTLACAGTRAPRLALPDGGHLNLTVPGPMAEGLALTQHFLIVRGQTRFAFEGQVELEPGRLTVIGLTPVASRGFAADWREARLSYDHLPFYRLPLAPAELLAAWQLAFLTPAALAPALSEAEAELSEPAPGERIFRRHGRIWARVRTRTQASGDITHVDWLARGFSLVVTTRASETYPL